MGLMFTARLTAGISVFVLIFVGPAGCHETRKDRADARGKSLFELYCCVCHNGKSSGIGKIPPNLTGIFQRPRLPSGVPATAPTVRSAVLEGRSGIMPSFQGSLSDEQIEAIIHYLHTASPETRLCMMN